MNYLVNPSFLDRKPYIKKSNASYMALLKRFYPPVCIPFRQFQITFHVLEQVYVDLCWLILQKVGEVAKSAHQPLLEASFLESK